MSDRERCLKMLEDIANTPPTGRWSQDRVGELKGALKIIARNLRAAVLTTPAEPVEPQEQERWDASVEQIHRELSGEAPLPQEPASPEDVEALAEKLNARIAEEVRHAGNPRYGPVVSLSVPEAEAILAALLTTPAEPVAWQPIETAPKDGPQVLVWNLGGPAFSAFHHRHGWLSVPGAYQCYPTHWMPLPASPAEQP